MFLEQQISILETFLKEHVTLNTGIIQHFKMRFLKTHFHLISENSLSFDFHLISLDF